MSQCMNGGTHGPVHILIGGAWGDDDVNWQGVPPSIQSSLKVLLFKILWRTGFTRCPAPNSCSSSGTHSRRAVYFTPVTLCTLFFVDHIVAVSPLELQFLLQTIAPVPSPTRTSMNSEQRTFSTTQAYSKPSAWIPQLTQTNPASHSYWPSKTPGSWAICLLLLVCDSRFEFSD